MPTPVVALGLALALLAGGLAGLPRTRVARSGETRALGEVIRAARGQGGARFVVPDEETLEATHELVAELARAIRKGKKSPARGLDDSADALGLVLEEAKAGRERFIVLRERTGEPRGAGLYVFRTRKVAHPTVIEAPHTIYDTYTDALSRDVFVESDAFALFQNTVERYTLSERASDVAHTEASHFHAAHRAVVDAVAGVRAIQVHGFGTSARVPRRVDFIVSDGGRGTPTSDAERAVTAALGDGFGHDRVAIYGEGVNVLGGTTNLQGRYLNEARGAVGDFVHLEISKSVRSAFVRDAGARARLIEAIAEVVGERWTD